MTLFQWIGVPLLGLLLVATLIGTARHRLVPRVGLGWSALWLLAALAIARPELTVAVARVLGIGRGTDLVLYLSILMMMVGFFALYIRYRRLQEEITQIVRAIAIMNVDRSEKDSSQ